MADPKDIISQLVQSAKKFPTAVVGGGVDLANMVLGGYANIADAVQGKPISRDIGEGLVKNPIGGTEHLNDLAGIDSKSGGLTEDSISAILGTLSPGGLAKGAMLVPATLLKSGSSIRMAEKMLASGADPKAVWNNLGIFKNAEGSLQSVIPDEMAALKIRDDLGGRINQVVGANDADFKRLTRSTKGNVVAPLDPTRLGDVLDHPQLFEAFPELADLHVQSGAAPGAKGDYSPGTKTIRVNNASDEAFLSTLLHETQHAVQDSVGASNYGASPAMFFRDLPGYNRASTEANRQFDDVITRGMQPGAADPNLVLEAKNASKMTSVFKATKQKAFDNYASTSGEVEARLTQSQHRTGDYDSFPPDQMDIPLSDQILDPWTHPHVDDDPMVRAVVRYMNDTNAANPGK